MATTRHKRWLIRAGVLAGLCAVFGLFPHHGPPHFRYTGSDPARDVWNFGYPLATMIWDPEHGLQVGPLTMLVYPLTVLVGGFMYAMLRLAVRLRRWCESPDESIIQASQHQSRRRQIGIKPSSR